MQLWSKAQPQVGTLSRFLLISRMWQTPGTQAISSRLIPIFFADAVPFYIHCNLSFAFAKLEIVIQLSGPEFFRPANIAGTEFYYLIFRCKGICRFLAPVAAAAI